MNDGDRPRISRRAVLRRGAWSCAAGLPRVALSASDAPIRIGTTSVILDNQVGFLHAWRDYLQPRLGGR